MVAVKCSFVRWHKEYRARVFPFETSNARKSMNTKLRTNAPVMNASAFNIAISKSIARWYKEEFPSVLPTKKQSTKSKEGNSE